MIEQFINFVIRPPRAVYDPDQYLWDKDFTLAGKPYQRQDLELQNGRGQTLRCSHYVPQHYLENEKEDSAALPCVVYCHGNSGCRADANEAALVLLPANITVFTLDFAGSGLSDGNYVTLGWHEKDDLGAVVSYLRNNNRVSHIGLWGRSMGAVTSLLYGSGDPSISGMVLDSAFSDLFDLMMELVDVYKIRLPKFTVKVAVQYMRRVIQKRARFDIKDLNCMQASSRTCIPALFAHANGDRFIKPHHSDLIFKLYAGKKNIIKFDGDHNSPRPQVYYDSVSIFFYNTLKPPQSSVLANKIGKCHSLKDVDGMDEGFLYEIISNLQIASDDVASSSSTFHGISTIKAGGDIFSEIVPALCTSDETYQEDMHTVHKHFQDETNVSIEECCSYTSSNRESWGRCSSVGASDAAEDSLASSSHQLIHAPVATKELLQDQSKSPENNHNIITEKVASSAQNKPRHEQLERLGSFGHRLRLSILRRVRYRKYA